MGSLIIKCKKNRILMILTLVFLLVLFYKVDCMAEKNVKSEKITLTVGESTSILAPKKTVKYLSGSKKTVIVTKKGIVAAKNAGTATIKVSNGKTEKKYTIIVKEPKLKLQSKRIEISIGDTSKIAFQEKAPSGVTFQSRDNSIATVSKNGIVKGKKSGKTTIIVKYKKQKASVTVFVSDKDIEEDKTAEELENENSPKPGAPSSVTSGGGSAVSGGGSVSGGSGGSSNEKEDSDKEDDKKDENTETSDIEESVAQYNGKSLIGVDWTVKQVTDNLGNPDRIDLHEEDDGSVTYVYQLADDALLHAYIDTDNKVSGFLMLGNGFSHKEITLGITKDITEKDEDMYVTGYKMKYFKRYTSYATIGYADIHGNNEIFMMIIYRFNEKRGFLHTSTGAVRAKNANNDEYLNMLINTTADYINTFRSYKGLHKLELSEELNRAAYLHAHDMLDNNYYSHTSLDGRTFDKRIEKEIGRKNICCGENISASTGAAYMDFTGFISSEGHRKNILNSKYKKLGLCLASRDYEILDEDGYNIDDMKYQAHTVHDFSE